MSTETAIPIIPFHPDHNDPTADWVIQVEKTRFRVHSYCLKAHSAYFRDLPGQMPALHKDSDGTIALEGYAPAFSSLLKLLNSEKTPISEVYTLQEAQRFGERYGFTTVPGLVAGRMEYLTNSTPWEVLRYAAEHRLLGLGKLAISRMTRDRHKGELTNDKFTSSDFHKFPGTWAAALLLLFNRYPTYELKNPDWMRDGQDFLVCRDWGAISGYFNPGGLDRPLNAEDMDDD